jgi:hypothetical protein
MAWQNSDGLRVKFGREEATVGKAGEYEFDGPIHWTEVDVVGTDLTSSDAPQDDNTIIPKGARIKSVTLYVETAFTSGGSATLTVGTYKTDYSAASTAAGFISAQAVAGLTAGATITGGGSTVGTTLSENVLVSVKCGTAAFTAGKGKLRIDWYVP